MFDMTSRTVSNIAKESGNMKNDMKSINYQKIDRGLSCNG